MNHSNHTLISSKMDVYNILRVFLGWQWRPPAQRLLRKDQGCFTPQQRASSEEAARQRAPGTSQHQVRTHGAGSLVFFSGVRQADRLMLFSSCCVNSMKRAASLNYLNKTSDDPFQVSNTKINLK